MGLFKKRTLKEKLLKALSPEALDYLSSRLLPPEYPAEDFVDSEVMFSITTDEELPSEKGYPYRPARRLGNVCTQIIEDICENDSDDGFDIDEVFESREDRIRKELEQIQKKYGVTLDEIEKILGLSVKPGRLKITSSGKIFLPDNDNAEIRLDDLSQAVYLLFLRHPEGIRFKALNDFRKELLDIYLSLTGKDDMDAIQSSIDSLVDPFDNSINVKVSRIKHAFIKVLGDRMARFYYISGPSGGLKSIPLDRSLVVTE